MFHYDDRPAVEYTETLGDKRRWLLERAEQIEQQLIEKVREDYAKGVPIKRIAQKAQVSRPTIYRWIDSTTPVSGNAQSGDGH